jgi:hypothetical protein
VAILSHPHATCVPGCMEPVVADHYVLKLGLLVEVLHVVSFDYHLSFRAALEAA